MANNDQNNQNDKNNLQNQPQSGQQAGQQRVCRRRADDPVDGGHRDEARFARGAL